MKITVDTEYATYTYEITDEYNRDYFMGEVWNMILKCVDSTTRVEKQPIPFISDGSCYDCLGGEHGILDEDGYCKCCRVRVVILEQF